ncbi:hypothetical protein SAY86_016440 [Trapa natans]|uniref:Transcription factor GTE4 n=1 Tax=Trapa natans TaxID=22666 RepID=A0AAN7L6W0_TRANT|nr:hypothetical protein SAY86_016440 [Trapa natans]
MEDLGNHYYEPNRDDEGAASDDSSSSHPLGSSSFKRARGPIDRSSFPGYIKSGRHVRISISSRSKNEIRELKRKLIGELDQVKSLLKLVESKQVGMYPPADGYAHSQVSANQKVGSLARVNSEVGSVGPPASRQPPGVTVSAADSNNGACGEFIENRTAKANNMSRGSKIMADKVKYPPVDSNKMMKKADLGINDIRDPGFVADKQLSQLFKSCSNLLARLMKHKFSWVFNNPVDAEALGLHDYFTIIKHPMDLGTVRTRLNKNWYKSPREFAEDVRLTFHNAMLYNPKGQDVHFMADTLLKMFEEKWSVMEEEHNLDFRKYDMASETPTSKKPPASAAAPPTVSALHTQARNMHQLESTRHPVESGKKLVNAGHAERAPVPKKPKAKDFTVRKMTYEEKQKLSDNLQNLPSEKLEDVVQIIKKRNPHLFQQEDEIEVDIDSVDLETLWELDGFVMNHKKNMSKNKRKAEAALQESAEAGHDALESNQVDPANAPKENVKVVSSPVRVEKHHESCTRLSSSGGSLSSTGSGSSSSDSDSDGSSS